MTRRSCVFASTTCTDTEALWVSEGLSLVLWSFAATVEGLFTSLCATVTDAGRPSCASNCMKQTLSSFITSEPLSLTTLYLIHFSQISVLKKKKKTLKDFRHSLIQERPALSLPVLFLIRFFKLFIPDSDPFLRHALPTSFLPFFLAQSHISSRERVRSTKCGLSCLSLCLQFCWPSLGKVSHCNWDQKIFFKTKSNYTHMKRTWCLAQHSTGKGFLITQITWSAPMFTVAKARPCFWLSDGVCCTAYSLHPVYESNNREEE